MLVHVSFLQAVSEQAALTLDLEKAQGSLTDSEMVFNNPEPLTLNPELSPLNPRT